MAASKITFADKVGIIPKETRINQVWDDDINEIKAKFNTNANLIDTNTADILTNAADINTLKNDGKKPYNVINKNVNYTANINDYILCNSSLSEVTITLPNAVTSTGYELNITKVDSSVNNVILDTYLSQTINGSLTKIITSQYDNVTVISDGANWFIK